MNLPLAVLSLLQATQVEAPLRPVRDSEFIATAQGATPSGVQSLLSWRVGGVRFGVDASDLWVAVPNNVHRIAWRGNRVLVRCVFEGTPA